MADGRRRPLIGVLCCNEVNDRPVQVVASRFVEPLSRLSDLTVLLVPAIVEATDVVEIASILDGLLLTGSRTHVEPCRYGAAAAEPLPLDPARDEVALRTAGRMIEAGKPVFGICRGLQEINVLFGGTLSADHCRDRHHLGSSRDFAAQFEHRHDVSLTAGGLLARSTGLERLTVNSVHEQAIDRLGAGLAVEATATDDGIVEGVSARPVRAPVLGVQWHPEWSVRDCRASRRFFELVGDALRG